MDISTLSNDIIKNLSTIPGILGFCNIDETNKVLKDSKTWIKALSIIIHDEKVNLNIAIIISVDATIDNISKQIKEQAIFDLENNNLKLGNLNINIKGIK